jgi:hypothetical protein
MSETAATYTVTDMTETAKSDQEDQALRHLGRRVALYHAELIEAGMDREVAKHLTDEFQDHLLSIAVGPHVYPPLDMEMN